MLKKFNLTVVVALILSGCTNTDVNQADVEYGKVLSQEPKWTEKNYNKFTKMFFDSSIDKESPFLRVKSVSTLDGGAVSENIYRLDCANQRVANYYSKITQKPVIEKTKEDYGHSEYASGTNSEEYLYNPTQPNSLDRLWRTFPVGDNLFSNQCALKGESKKPKNTELPDWTYSEDLSKLNHAATYVKSDQFKAFKSTGVGELTIKRFSVPVYDTNSSNENELKVDCKANTIDLVEMTWRDSDFEYAPAPDQSVFSFKTVVSMKDHGKNKADPTKTIEGDNVFIKVLCS